MLLQLFEKCVIGYVITSFIGVANESLLYCHSLYKYEKSCKMGSVGTGEHTGMLTSK